MIITYPWGEYGLGDNQEDSTPAEVMAYEDIILAAIVKESRYGEYVTLNWGHV